MFWWVFPIGLICGLCSSAPIGPINLWVADSVLQRPRRPLGAFLVAVVLVDACFAGLAAWGVTSLGTTPRLSLAIGLVGGAFLVALGGLSLWRHRPKAVTPEGLQEAPAAAKTQPMALTHAKGFAAGAMMTGTNPGFLLFWVMVSGLLTNYLGHGFTLIEAALFLSGIVVGDLLWFSLISTLVRSGGRRLRPHTVGRIRRGLAYVFIAMGTASCLQAMAT